MQAWLSCSLLLGDMDTTAMQVLEEEEVGRWLGHPGLKGKGVAGGGSSQSLPLFQVGEGLPGPSGVSRGLKCSSVMWEETWLDKG